MDRIDIIIFGATGFTGLQVVNHFLRIEREKEYNNLKWGVAGRSIEKLTQLKGEILDIRKDIADVQFIRSNVHDELSLKNMTKKCRVLINCVGPFSVLGEPVVKACIETGTHYLDISAEAHNILNVYKKYNDAAEKANVLIIPACGFCNIPMAAGIMYLRDNFQGVLNTVELYGELGIPKYAHYPGPNNILLHYGTWSSLVYVLKDMRKYVALRDEIFTEPLQELSVLKKSFLHRHEDQTWFTYPGPDGILIAMSEKQFEKTHTKKPIQFKAYTTFPCFFHFIVIPAIYICYYLCYFACFSRFMRKYPRISSLGFASFKGPTIETREKTTYKFTLFGKEWDNHSVKNSLVVEISGKDPGYDTTAAALIASAITVIEDASTMPKGGVVMPGAAFYDTDIINRLKKQGFKFQLMDRRNQIN